MSLRTPGHDRPRPTRAARSSLAAVSGPKGKRARPVERAQGAVRCAVPARHGAGPGGHRERRPRGREQATAAPRHAAHAAPTFASLAMAHGRDARWVMAQIGHTDARLTLSVYAQVVQRRQVDVDLIAQLMAFASEATFGPRNRPLSKRVAPNAPEGPDPRPSQDLELVRVCGGSGRRASNPRPQAWEACALPTELRPPGARRVSRRRRDEPLRTQRVSRLGGWG